MKQISRGTFSVLCMMLLSVISFESKSQSNTLPTGFYVDLKGNKITGSFNSYKEWTINPKKVDFIEDESKKEIKLTPINCISFTIDGKESYVAYSGTCLSNPTELTSQSSQKDSSNNFDIVSTFLRSVIKQDDIQILALNNTGRNNYFYQTNDGAISELIFKVFLNDDLKLQKDEKYKRQLFSQLFNKVVSNDQLEKQLSQLEYKEASLVRFINKAYSIKADKKKSKYKSTYFVTGGISFNSFKATGNAGIPQAKTSYSNHTSPLLHFGVNIYTQRGFGKLFFSPQVKVFTSKHSGEIITTNNINISTLHKTNYTSNFVIDPSFNLGYTLAKSDMVEWNISGGFGLLLFSNHIEKVNSKNLFTNSVSETQTKMKQVAFHSNFQTSLIFSKHIILNLGYILPTPITDYNNYNGKMGSLQISAGYRF